MKSTILPAAVLVGLALSAIDSKAGPYILAGTDADDHGFATVSGNSEGWFFMQRSLETIANSSTLTSPNQAVYVLGSDAGTTASEAAQSAFNFSSLVSAGWSINFVDGAAALSSFFSGGMAGAGILMMDSGANVFGGISDDEAAVLTANASAINSFLGTGGGVFSQANSYGWLSALLPGVGVDFSAGQGIELTSAGNTLFPGLTNEDLSSGPYHANFTGVGSIPVLGRGVDFDANLNIIIGSSGGSITDPLPAIPEPSTYALMIVGLGVVGLCARRRKSDCTTAVER